MMRVVKGIYPSSHTHARRELNEIKESPFYSEEKWTVGYKRCHSRRIKKKEIDKYNKKRRNKVGNILVANDNLDSSSLVSQKVRNDDEKNADRASSSSYCFFVRGKKRTTDSPPKKKEIFKKRE